MVDQEIKAERQHAIWAHWMQYQFTCCTKNGDGSLVIPADKVVRWKRQAETAYADLSDLEKQSDRDIVTQFGL